MSSSSDDDDSYSASQLNSLNISNDQYYERRVEKFVAKAVGKDLQLPSYGSRTIRHSLPAYDLWPRFFPTYPSADRLRNLHRPKLRHYHSGPQAINNRSKGTKWFPIKNLTPCVFKFQRKLRNKVIRAINQGYAREYIAQELLTINRAKELTAKYGELALFEYSEENPPVLSQIGMSSNVKIYTFNPGINNSSKTAKAASNPIGQENDYPKSNDDKIKLGFQERILDEKKAKRLYFDPIKPGSSNMMIENNLFRAPIYEHSWNETDFLVVRTRNSFYIRCPETIYIVGQTMPLALIPQPNDSSICRFRSGFSNFHINMQLLASNPAKPSLDFDQLLKSFPDYPRNNLYKRLSSKGGKLKNIGETKMFVFEEGIRIPKPIDLKSVRASFTPEHYCLNMATLEARQRLRDLNYTESMIDHRNVSELETEILAAPWNTSRAVLDTIADKSLLDLKNHLIDPTGMQREGFSCVAWPKSPTELLQLQEMRSKNIPIQQVTNGKKQIIMKNPLICKIRREKLERVSVYNREAQLLTEVQSKVLASKEVLSSDEDDPPASSSDDENLLDKSLDQQLNDLDKLVFGNRTMTELNHEKEEEERHRMLKEFKADRSPSKNTATVAQLQSDTIDKSNTLQASDLKHKVLRIIRTYPAPDGFISRTEIVREAKIIALYVKQKTNTISDVQQNKNCRTNGVLNISADEVFLSSKPRNLAKRTAFQKLGPTELCRTDGMRITISKRVLDPGITDRARRASQRAT